jgi:hypothetical protein
VAADWNRRRGISVGSDRRTHRVRDTLANESPSKKTYTAPELVVHGSVEEITADQNKGFGLSDGFLFMGVPIKNIS